MNADAQKKIWNFVKWFKHQKSKSVLFSSYNKHFTFLKIQINIKSPGAFRFSFQKKINLKSFFKKKYLHSARINQALLNISAQCCSEYNRGKRSQHTNNLRPWKLYKGNMHKTNRAYVKFVEMTVETISRCEKKAKEVKIYVKDD